MLTELQGPPPQRAFWPLASCPGCPVFTVCLLHLLSAAPESLTTLSPNSAKNWTMFVRLSIELMFTRAFGPEDLTTSCDLIDGESQPFVRIYGIVTVI
jgi:hypothetical protein